MEHKEINRGWVKNAAIIFLAVLLVLTFFSNTIMNRTLPEVATQSAHQRQHHRPRPRHRYRRRETALSGQGRPDA